MVVSLMEIGCSIMFKKLVTVSLDIMMMESRYLALNVTLHAKSVLQIQDKIVYLALTHCKNYLILKFPIKLEDANVNKIIK
jgi:hypothetical protein